MPEFYSTLSPQSTASEKTLLYTPKGEPVEMYGFKCRFHAALTKHFAAAEKEGVSVPQSIRFEITLDPTGNATGKASEEVTQALAEKIKKTEGRAGFRFGPAINRFEIDTPPVGDPLRFITNFYEVYIRETARRYAQGKDPLELNRQKSPDAFDGEPDPYHPIISGTFSRPFLLNLRHVEPVRVDASKKLAGKIARAAEDFFKVDTVATHEQHRQFARQLITDGILPAPRADTVCDLALRWFPYEPKGSKTEVAPVLAIQHQEFARELHDMLKGRGR